MNITRELCEEIVENFVNDVMNEGKGLDRLKAAARTAALTSIIAGPVIGLGTHVAKYKMTQPTSAGQTYFRGHERGTDPEEDRTSSRFTRRDIDPLYKKHPFANGGDENIDVPHDRALTLSKHLLGIQDIQQVKDRMADLDAGEDEKHNTRFNLEQSDKITQNLRQRHRDLASKRAYPYPDK